MKKTKITNTMLISDIISKYPQTIEVFLDYGIHCFGCHVARFETIEEGLKVHGLDVDEVMKELNDIIKEDKK